MIKIILVTALVLWVSYNMIHKAHEQRAWCRANPVACAAYEPDDSPRVP